MYAIRSYYEMLLSNEKYLKKNEKEKWLVRKLSFIYEKALGWALYHKRVIVLSTLAVLVLAIVTLSGLGRSFFPAFNEGSLTISVITIV